MNAPFETLRAVCRENPVAEKVLLVPTYGVGQRITDTLARSGTHWIGIRTLTLEGLALELSSDLLVREGRSLLSRAQALSLVESACEDVLSDDDYFGALRHSTGFFRSIRRSIDDLRISGVRSAGFPAGAFPNRRKAAEIQRILARYEELLDRNRFVDRAGLYELASRSIGDTPRHERVFSAGIRDLRPMQKVLLDSVAREHVLLQEVDESEPLPIGRKQKIGSARGSENEVRAVLRRAVHDRIPLDAIEIVHTNRDLYVPLILELTSELGIEATFDEGIPVSYTRPGQAILGFLEWLRLEWDATVLRKLISSGVIETKGIGPILAARLFRNATVGWGRRRHLDRMDALVSEYERRSRHSEGRERAERGLGHARTVRKLVRGLIRHTPRQANEVSVSELAGHASEFLNRFARVASARDGAGKEALLRVLDEVRSLPDRRESLTGATARLDELVREISVASEAPRPGAVHVAPVETAGWGGRERLFVVGLDERFPGGGLQDPILLDEERSIVNRKRKGSDLTLSGNRPDQVLRDLRWLLDRTGEAETTFLFSSEDLLEARELLPSPFLLDMWRSVHEKPDATYDDMLGRIGEENETFVTSRPISESEEWIRRVQEASAAEGLSQDEREAAIEAMAESWPWLGRGLTAARARAGREISPWSGKIEVAPEEIDPRLTRKPLSASRIEKLAGSPFRYFLEHVLRVEPLQELERKPEEWLEAREFGRLFHDVLYEFMSAVVGRSEKPGLPAHRSELERIALRALDGTADEIPPPSSAAFEVRRKELLEACELFLTEERIWCESAVPRWFEVPFGMPSSSGAGIGSDESVEIDLGFAGSILIRGRIDRIDECGAGRFGVWDYKSGSSYRYSDQDYLAKGTQVQHAVYAVAARELLERHGIGGEVVEGGYYFPTRKGRALRIRRIPPFTGQQRESFEAVLGGLLDTVGKGSFIHAIEEDDCKFCDFVSICGGNVKAIAEQTKRMSRSSEDPGVLAYLRATEVE